MSYICFGFINPHMENGAVYGGFYDFATSHLLFYIEDSMSEIIREGWSNIKLKKYVGFYEWTVSY